VIVILEPDLTEQRAVIDAVRATAARYPGVTVKPYEFEGTTHRFGEVHLIGSTAAVPTAPFEQLPGVRQVVRVSAKYRLIGRHDGARAMTIEIELFRSRIEVLGPEPLRNAASIHPARQTSSAPSGHRQSSSALPFFKISGSHTKTLYS